MINDRSGQSRQTGDKLNFITTNTPKRDAEGFIESTSEGSNLYLELYDGQYRTNRTLVLEIPLSKL